MRDLITEGRKIYESFKKNMNESIANATIGKNQKGKTAVFFPDKNTFVKELKKYLPKDTKISSSRMSFGGFGHGVSIAFKFNGIDFSSIGGQPTVELLEGLLAFRKGLETQFHITTGDNSYMIGFGDNSDYDVALGIPDTRALERMITHWKSKSTQESVKNKMVKEAFTSEQSKAWEGFITHVLNKMGDEAGVEEILAMPTSKLFHYIRGIINAAQKSYRPNNPNYLRLKKYMPSDSEFDYDTFLEPTSAGDLNSSVWFGQTDAVHDTVMKRAFEKWKKMNPIK